MNQDKDQSGRSLTIDDLTVSFDMDGERNRVVEGASLSLAGSSKTAIVGESGSGKTVMALSVLRLLACPPAHIEQGRILWGEDDLLALPERKMRKIRGNEIAIVFQDPLSSLTPVYTVGFQVVEALRVHQRISRRAAKRRAIEMLGDVGLDNPSLRYGAYPHELSGGMRQRVMIAMALINRPALLIADEPTSALDVTTQAHILDLLDTAQKQHGTSTLLITHDMGVAASFADRIIVMYAGQIVEAGTTADVLNHPIHPYTRGLLASIPPSLGDTTVTSPHVSWRAPMPGRMPPPGQRAGSCRFAPRCPHVHERCREGTPTLENAEDGRQVRCWGPLPARIDDKRQVIV